MSTLLFPGKTKPNINHTIINPIIPKYNNIVNWGEITGEVRNQEDIIDYVENELNQFDKAITTNLKRKQDIIEDLDEIRRGSNLGKTALQTISTKRVEDLKDGSEYIKRSETDDKIAETDIEYDMVLTTTTNLPLSYEIYQMHHIFSVVITS